MKVEHYNDAHPNEEQIEMIWDFAEDILEGKIENGLEKKDEDGEAA